MPNASRVRRPKWTGRPGEYAIVVSAGEPSRTAQEVAVWVADQITAYLAEHTEIRLDQDTEVALVQRIVEEHYGLGRSLVALTREHLLAYVALITPKEPQP